MRAVLSFFSSLALGLMIAAILVVGATRMIDAPTQLSMPGTLFDYASVIVGLGMGLVIAIVGQIHWSELPGRVAKFVMRHAYRLRLLAWAALFTAVLIYF